MDLYLSLGDAGLSLADIGPRLYRGIVRVDLPDAVTLAAIGAEGDYEIRNLPEEPGVPYWFTCEYPEGVGIAETWGLSVEATLPAVILPVREAGLVAADFGLLLLRDGAADPAVLRVADLGTVDEPGDYAVSGWRNRQDGERWALRWELAGVRFLRSWGAGASPGDRLDVGERALRAFTALWRAADPPAPLVSMPLVLPGGAGYRPPNQEPFVELDLISDHGEQSGPVGMRIFDATGILQVSAHVRGGDGRDLATALLRIASGCVDGMRVEGLRLYGCRLPYDLPAPLQGYYARAVDAPARYVGI